MDCTTYKTERITLLAREIYVGSQKCLQVHLLQYLQQLNYIDHHISSTRCGIWGKKTKKPTKNPKQAKNTHTHKKKPTQKLMKKGLEKLLFAQEVTFELSALVVLWTNALVQ